MRRVELMEAALGEELVALDASAGTCFGFNEVATSVWRLLDSPKSVDDLQAALLTEYEIGADQCRVELRQLLDDMVAKRLVKVE